MKRNSKLILFITIFILLIASAQADELDAMKQYFALRDTLNHVLEELNMAINNEPDSSFLNDPDAEKNIEEILSFLRERIDIFVSQNHDLRHFYQARLEMQHKMLVRAYPQAIMSVLSHKRKMADFEPPAPEQRPFFTPIEFRSLLSPVLEAERARKIEAKKEKAETLVKPAPKFLHTTRPTLNISKDTQALPAFETKKPSKKDSVEQTQITQKQVAPSKPVYSKTVPSKPVLQKKSLPPSQKTVDEKKPAPTKIAALPSKPASTKSRQTDAPMKKTQTPDYSKEAELLRPFAIMIENHNRSRPQSGLYKADVVFEIPVEGGITRFMAIYYDTPPKVGPLRSCRSYFIKRAIEIEALYVHCGASPLGYQMISRTGISSIDELRQGRPFYRDNSRRAPHNLYSSGQRLYDFMAQRVSMRVHNQIPLFKTSNTPSKSHIPVNAVSIRYHNNYTVNFKYADGAYNRYMNGVKHIDRETKTPIRASAIIIQEVPMRVVDSEGRLEMNFVGEGPVTILQSGTKIEGKWKKDSQRDLTRYYDKFGNRIEFYKTGQKWIQVVSPRNRVTYE